MIAYFLKLNSIFTKKDRVYLFLLFLFSVAISLIETVGISLVMPFITVASNFHILESNKYFHLVYTLTGISSPLRFVLIFGGALIFFYLFRCVMNLLYIYYLGKFSNGRYYIFTHKLFQNYLSLNYIDYVKRNSSLMTKNIVTEANYLTAMVYQGLLFVSEILIVTFLYILLLFVNWRITLMLTLVLMITAFLVFRNLTLLLRKAGDKRSVFQDEFYRVLNDTFGNFKMVKLVGAQSYFSEKFRLASYGLAKQNLFVNLINNGQKPIMESLGYVTLLILVLVVLVSFRNPAYVIPLISMYALAFLRLLPSFNRMSTAWNTLVFFKGSLNAVYEDLYCEGEPMSGNEPINFNRLIELNNVSFSYNKTAPDVLMNIDLRILKGQRVAFVGESGSGKSSLIDILIGIFSPRSGEVLIDGGPLTENNRYAWRQKIGYIPQNIYLIDGSVAENVACGRPINEEKIIDALEKAKIFDFLETKEGLDTRVGEGGVMLSGGQKQRIAIARALYSDPDILVLDEATSALDHETEKRIMEEIFELSKRITLIIVAHRLTTISQCDTVYKIESGRLCLS